MSSYFKDLVSRLKAIKKDAARKAAAEDLNALTRDQPIQKPAETKTMPNSYPESKSADSMVPEEEANQAPTASSALSLDQRFDDIKQNFRGSRVAEDTVIANLNVLKSTVDQPKESCPDLRFNTIRNHLGDAECHETIRQERWVKNVVCPYCQKKKVKRIEALPDENPNNYRYECGHCERTFNDDTETPFRDGFPPIAIWMQCWYLTGCTNSMPYIAAKLNLELAVIEKMVAQLQKLFNAKQPLSRFMSYNDWKNQSHHFEQRLREAMASKKELFTADTPHQPKDTAELRRQSSRRRKPPPKSPV